MSLKVPWLTPWMHCAPRMNFVCHETREISATKIVSQLESRGGRVLPYMGYIGMCRCEGYGFQAVYSSIGYIDQSVWVTKLTSWLKILSRLRKPGIATQKYKKMKSASLNFHDSASTALIDDYHKTLLDIINCQKSGFRRKSVVLILVKIKQFIVLIMRTYVLGIAGQV